MGKRGERQRRFPIGAEFLDKGVNFRVWAPESKSVTVILDESDAFPLTAETNGYFSTTVSSARPGSLYKFRLDAGTFPDPASRYQPEGPHGPSAVVDPGSFHWTDQNWRGLPVEDIVIYELHLGTFTPAGTWRAAEAELPELKRLGVTLIEIMPIAEFSGEFGWGYDGVDLFAPTRLYGTPDDARSFVNRAHELGLMVILDVVYNHLGPDGNYLGNFARDYFSPKYKCEWGEAINFDGPNSAPVREFFTSNARYWIEEFHFDGLRLDATQQIFDNSPRHILADIAQAARRAGAARQIYLVGENEPQNTDLVRAAEKGGCSLDALWNDDFHHSALVAATGKTEAYYSDYKGSPQEFISSIKYGYLFQGQYYRWQKKRRGSPAFDLHPRNFVTFLQNHDQIANSLRGSRLRDLTSPGKLRALASLTLLGPSTPMLFMGDEFGATTPFLYFADHNAELNKLISQGRHDFIKQFRSVACEECADLYAQPGDRQSFERCKLDLAQRVHHRGVYQFHIDLLHLRKSETVIAKYSRLDGAVLSDGAFVIRYFAQDGQDRLLLINLGADLELNPAPEPLLSPLRHHGWTAAWSSQHPSYGGCGTPPLETVRNWIIPAESALWLVPSPDAQLKYAKFDEKD